MYGDHATSVIEPDRVIGAIRPNLDAPALSAWPSQPASRTVTASKVHVRTSRRYTRAERVET